MSDQDFLDVPVVPGEQGPEVLDLELHADGAEGARLQVAFMLRALEGASPEEQVWITEDDWQAAEKASAWLDSTGPDVPPPADLFDRLQDSYVHLYPDGQPVPEEQLVGAFAAMSLDALCPECGAFRVYELAPACGHCGSANREEVAFLGNRPVGGTDSERRRRVIHRCRACVRRLQSPPGPCRVISICGKTAAHVHVMHRRWPMRFLPVCGGSRTSAPGSAERGCGWSRP